MRRTDLLLEVHSILGQEWQEQLTKQVGKEEARRLREKFIELTEKAEHEAVQRTNVAARAAGQGGDA